MSRSDMKSTSRFPRPSWARRSGWSRLVSTCLAPTAGSAPPLLPWSSPRWSPRWAMASCSFHRFKKCYKDDVRLENYIIFFYNRACGVRTVISGSCHTSPRSWLTNALKRFFPLGSLSFAQKYDQNIAGRGKCLWHHGAGGRGEEQVTQHERLTDGWCRQVRLSYYCTA